MPDADRIRFDLGRVVATPGALDALQAAGTQPGPLLERHRRGDFGGLDSGDAATQTRALNQEDQPEHRERMMSVYELPDGVVVWIITETDRSSTCLLLPDEY
jgi:hypothetical protein